MFERGTKRGKVTDGNVCARKRDLFGGSGSAWVAQLVERVLGKDEVTGSIPVPGSRNSVSRGRATERLESSGGNSTVESHSSKVMVAGSNPVPRSRIRAPGAIWGEAFGAKDESVWQRRNLSAVNRT